MDDSYITRQEYTADQKRLEAEDTRQNRRIELLEETVKQNEALTISVEKLAINMENMLKEQERQNSAQEAALKRIASLESKEGEQSTKILQAIGSFIAGVAVAVVAAYIRAQIGV